MGGESMKKRPTAKQRREAKLVNQLTNEHCYMFIELRHKDERETSLFSQNRKTGKTTIAPAVCIRLVVPLDSNLGQGIEAMRKKKAKEGKKR
jgi:hypothetical protein